MSGVRLAFRFYELPSGVRTDYRALRRCGLSRQDANFVVLGMVMALGSGSSVVLGGPWPAWLGAGDTEEPSGSDQAPT